MWLQAREPNDVGRTIGFVWRDWLPADNRIGNIPLAGDRKPRPRYEDPGLSTLASAGPACRMAGLALGESFELRPTRELVA